MVSVSNSKYDYSDDTIIIVLTPEYSTVGAVVNRPQLDFGDINIQTIENIFPITNQKAIETLHSRGLQYQAIYKIILPTHDKDKVIETIQILKQIEGVESASPNYYYPAVVTPDDTDYEQQWGLHGVYGIQTPEAWDINTGSASTRIGIVDSGISNHPELAQNLTTGWDFVNNNDITDDPHGHGTHIAGVIGAVGNNAQGIAGINWNTTLVPLQVYQYHNETGVYMNGAAIISAIAYATNTWGTAEQISVLNYSVDGYGNDTLTRTAVNNYPGLFVWAAGNSNRDVDPDIAAFGSFNLPNIIAVGSITEAGERSNFSNFSTSNQNVHIYAPGTAIYSTMINGTYASWSGTSMATPFAVGVAGLLLSRNPTLTASQLKTFITTCYDPLTITIPQGEQTIKKLNAYQALIGDAYLPPENFTGWVEGENIVLSWTAPIGVTPLGYNVYRGVSTIPINSTPISTLGYTDHSVTLGNIYVYAVRSMYAEAESNHTSSIIFNMNAPVYTFENAISSSWHIVNGSEVNRWIVGNATASSSGYSIYISDDNIANNYTLTTASIVHFYRDIMLTEGNDNTITFDVKVGGQSGADFLLVYLCEPSVTPTAGSYPIGTLLGEYCMTGGWQAMHISLPTQQENTQKRIVWTWGNNASVGQQPPVAIDNISFSDVGPNVNISPTSGSFGGLEPGNTSPAQPFIITNTGNTTLTIDSISLVGTHASQFAHNITALPVNITPGGNYTFSVTFTPELPAGYKNANINIHHNAIESPTTVFLSGRCMGDVATIPYVQMFADTAFPPVSPDWLAVDKDGDNLGWYLSSGTARSDSYYQNIPVTPDNWLITQPFTFEAGVTYGIRWSHRASNTARPNDFLSVYLMTGIHPELDCIDNAPGNTTIYAGTSTTGWQAFTHTFTPEQTIVRFIGFRHHNCTYQYGIQIDNIYVFREMGYDLGILQLTGPSTLPSQLPIQLTICNNSNYDVPAGGYQIAFKRVDPEGAVMPLGQLFTDTPAIVAWATTQITISDLSSWDFGVDTPTLLHFYAELIYPEDSSLENNLSEILPIYVYPYTVIVETMTGNITFVQYPIHFNMKDSLSQTLYTASELGGVTNRGRVVNMILWIMNMSHEMPPAFPVKIYMANVPASVTSLDDVIWYDFDIFTKVYDAPLPIIDASSVQVVITPGTGEDTEYFEYEGGGLVVMMYKSSDIEYSVSHYWMAYLPSIIAPRTTYFFSDTFGQIDLQNPLLSGVTAQQSPFPPGVTFYINQNVSVYDKTLPAGGRLLGNYPNPFNPSTTISFEVGREGMVALDVYNVRGQRVRSLVRGVYGAGVHKVVWNGVSDDGREVGSGVYFYRMTASGFSSVRKMLLIK